MILGLGNEVIYRIDKEILEEKAKQLLEPPSAAINISVDEVSYQPIPPLFNQRG